MKILILIMAIRATFGTGLVDRIAIIESQNNPAALGDRNRVGVYKSRGAYQITELAWEDVNRLRAKQMLPLFPWELAHDPGISREYAVQYLGILHRRLTTALKRPPTDGELVVAYQTGFERFKARKFSIRRSPPATRRALERIK